MGKGQECPEKDRFLNSDHRRVNTGPPDWNRSVRRVWNIIRTSPKPQPDNTRINPMACGLFAGLPGASGASSDG